MLNSIRLLQWFCFAFSYHSLLQRYHRYSQSASEMSNEDNVSPGRPRSMPPGGFLVNSQTPTPITHVMRWNFIPGKYFLIGQLKPSGNFLLCNSHHNVTRQGFWKLDFFSDSWLRYLFRHQTYTAEFLRKHNAKEFYILCCSSYAKTCVSSVAAIIHRPASTFSSNTVAMGRPTTEGSCVVHRKHFLLENAFRNAF